MPLTKQDEMALGLTKLIGFRCFPWFPLFYVAYAIFLWFSTFQLNLAKLSIFIQNMFWGLKMSEISKMLNLQSKLGLKWSTFHGNLIKRRFRVKTWKVNFPTEPSKKFDFHAQVVSNESIMFWSIFCGNLKNHQIWVKTCMVHFSRVLSKRVDFPSKLVWNCSFSR